MPTGALSAGFEDTTVNGTIPTSGQGRDGRPRVVIIGGGFAGLNAAKALRKADAEVVVIDRNNYHLFQPLLYQVATAGLSPGNIAHPIRAILRKARNTRVILSRVTAVDRRRRIVVLEDGEVAYDYCVVAAGMVNNYFGRDEWNRFAPGLKDIRDALDMRLRILSAFEAAERETHPEAIGRLLTFIVVGAGPTGVELAGAIREIAYEVMAKDFRRIDPRHARVILVEAGPRVLPSFPEKLSDKALRALQAIDVDVRTGTMVSAIDERGAMLGDAFVDAGTVLWTAGVKAASLTSTLGVETDRSGRVRVDRDLRIPGDERVFVVGDVARFEFDGKPPLPGMAPGAIQMGRHAAANIERLMRGEPTVPFEFHDKGQMATIGRGRAIADVFGLRFGGRIAWLAWLLVHVMQLIGFENRVAVMWQWAYAYLAFQRSARLIIR